MGPLVVSHVHDGPPYTFRNWYIRSLEARHRRRGGNRAFHTSAPAARLFGNAKVFLAVGLFLLVLFIGSYKAYTSFFLSTEFIFGRVVLSDVRVSCGVFGREPLSVKVRDFPYLEPRNVEGSCSPGGKSNQKELEK